MPRLTFRLKKRADADAQLILVREDGSHTAGRVGPAAGYGPVHDLAHYVVERTLALSEGFLGLVASGWAIADFEAKGAARRLPGEAMLAEMMAGELSREEMTGQFATSEDFSLGVAMWLARSRPDYAPPPLPAETLAAMRAELVELRQRWWEVEPGGSLELEFETGKRAECEPPRA